MITQESYWNIVQQSRLVHYCLVMKLCLTLCHSMDCSRQSFLLPCPSLSPWVCSNSCPLSWWWHPTISSSVIPFSGPQFFLASGSSPMSQFFASDGQNTGASTSASVLPVTIRDQFPLGWTGLISLQSKELSRVFSSTTIWSINSSVLSLVHGPNLISIHDYWKNYTFDYMDLCKQSDASAFWYSV